ncbi:MAG: hypothetical protein K0T01_2252, partial [Acidimicrobiia bacterium]|nr:hypothetical protein [Acidimicrobiia bacterium]
NLIPVFGIAASYALLGERLSARQWLGAVLIVTTMFVVGRNQYVADRNQSQRPADNRLERPRR